MKGLTRVLCAALVCGGFIGCDSTPSKSKPAAEKTGVRDGADKAPAEAKADAAPPAEPAADAAPAVGNSNVRIHKADPAKVAAAAAAAEPNATMSDPNLPPEAQLEPEKVIPALVEKSDSPHAKVCAHQLNLVAAAMLEKANKVVKSPQRYKEFMACIEQMPLKAKEVGATKFGEWEKCVLGADSLEAVAKCKS